MSVDITEMTPDPAILKTMVTPTEVAELLGLEVVNGKIPSPWNPDERTPSCHLWDDHFYDFGTGNHGDVIDLVRQLTGKTYNQALYSLWNKSLRAGKEPGDVDTVEVRNLVDFSDDFPTMRQWNPYSSWSKHLGIPLNFPWLALEERENGGSWSTAANFPLLIGHADENGVYGVKKRTWEGQKSAWPGSQFTHRLYHPYAWLPHRLEGAECIITEGESDAWAMTNVVPGDIPVFALPSGAQSWKDHWTQDLERYDTVHLAFDNDRAGKEAREKVTRKIGFLKAKDLMVPSLYKDVREAIVAGWKPEL